MRVGQSRKWSALEAATNMGIGIVINVVLNTAFVLLAGLRGHQAVMFTGVMSIVFLFTSTLRAYIIRRVFNHIAVRETVNRRMGGE